MVDLQLVQDTFKYLNNWHSINIYRLFIELFMTDIIGANHYAICKKK
jgi:hypothetical protein